MILRSAVLVLLCVSQVGLPYDAAADAGVPCAPGFCHARAHVSVT